uniref:E3 ubiquitin-protein ligase n=1 Tax=Sinocyclocheilus grahami TaxID=75366 RepID=A0A672T280_SINGR
MFDKDIIMLQIAASKMDPNHFLMLVLQRFELFDIFNGNSSSKDQEVLKQWNRLTEEMLYLIIIIVGERYVPGISHVTNEDVTMREVIHLLCIQAMAHSSLVKSLPENESHETWLETVISKVAVFKKPGVSGHGLYELKKECLKEFNPFFYHYSRPQHSKAEEAQKKRRTQEGSDKALRPPVPPPFCPGFSNIVYLLCCDIFIHILRRIFQKAVEDRSSRWTEPMIQRALHLVGQALLEEKTQLESNSTEEVSFDFSLKAQKTGSEHGKSLFHFLTKIKSLPSLNSQNDMITWNLQMFEVVKCLREKSGPVTSFSVDHSKLEESFQDKEKAERKRKAEAAKAHRQKIMAQMSTMQKNFIESNKMLYDNVPESLSQSDTAASVESFDVDESRVAVGPQQGVCSTDWGAQICILCQEEQEVQAQAPAMVLTACVQRSTLHCKNCIPLHLHVFLAVYLIIDLENGEFMCPLCKSLCNTVIPLIPVEPSKLNYESAELVGQHLTLERWIQIMSSRIRGLRGTWETDNNSEEAAEEAMVLFDESQADFRSILSFGVQEPPKFSRSITEMLGVCATTVHRVGLQTAPNDLCPYVPVMSWNTCAYTIQAIESMLQEEGKALFGSLQNRQVCAVFSFSEAEEQTSSHTEAFFLVPVPTVENAPSILEVDFFHLLVGLVLSIPALYQEEAVDLQPSAVSTAFNHLYLLHLVTMGHMLQILLASHDCAVIRGPEEGDEAQAAAELFSIVSQHTDGAGVSGFSVESVKRGVLPFLRCAALFFNCLTGVPPPEELSGTAESPESQLPLLCSYLSLPSNLFQLFQDHRDVVTTLIKRWCGDAAISKALKGEMQIIRYPRKRNRLIDLPEDYSVLLNQASHFKCPNSSDDERKHPTLCLLCGVMLCAQSPCCQQQLNGEEVGACTVHATICGAGVGMFLSCICLCFARRGNPLHLCPERYRKLLHMWQQHCILEEIARSLELLNVMFPFEWQML